jgi:hypothetical protein
VAGGVTMMNISTARTLLKYTLSTYNDTDAIRCPMLAKNYANIIINNIIILAI